MTGSRDRLEAALARIDDPAGEGARACLTVYHTGGARCRRRRRCARQSRHISRPARRRHRHHQGPVRRRRRSHARRFQGAGRGGQTGRGRRVGGAGLARRWRGDRRQDQHDRVRLFRRRHQSALRHAGQSGRPHAHSRRLHLRRRGGGGRRHVRDRHRQRHRRLDPHSRRRSAASSASSRAVERIPTDGAFPLSQQHRLHRSARAQRRSRPAPRPTR